MHWACERMRTASTHGRPPRATSVMAHSMTLPASTALRRSSLPAAPRMALAKTVSVCLFSCSRSVTAQMHSYQDCLTPACDTLAMGVLIGSPDLSIARQALATHADAFELTVESICKLGMSSCNDIGS